jgi:hypothetical protein
LICWTWHAPFDTDGREIIQGIVTEVGIRRDIDRKRARVAEHQYMPRQAALANYTASTRQVLDDNDFPNDSDNLCAGHHYQDCCPVPQVELAAPAWMDKSCPAP